MDKFDAMRVFVRVVESGTFTKASETLNLQKATVTRLVQMLEDDLATKLLNRTTRRVTVTPDGSAYYDRAVRLLADLEELENSMTGAKSNPKGRLRIDLPRPLAHSVVVPALPDFFAKYPDIDLEIGASDTPVDLFADNVDCAIRVGTVTDQSLVARQIGLSHFGLCASPDYWKKHGKPQHPSEIELHHTVIHMISARTAKPFPIVASHDSETVDIQGNKVLLCNDVPTCTDLARTGLGIICGGTFMIAPLIASGVLENCLEQWHISPMPVSIVYPPNRHLSNKLRVFVDWVAELFARHPSQKLS
ncbi:LysR family transcriptional regulator [Paraburkholderia dilworthii]|uniref:LysR family transcriptional regulator n=1 Tax=Paraburkholderia dilworthii TaxID=948106 RepID=UPI0004177857|nr:LysR family transcriptional regulator [Paraburkholderia dilworthii]